MGELIKEWTTNSAEETLAVGAELSMNCKPGELYCLNGDLGTGKTVFSQGFGKGLGIDEPISSPTFTILKEYHEGRIPMYHFDVYRIGSVDEMDEIGYYEFVDGDGVCLIEWSSMIEEILPAKRYEINIEKDVSQGFDYRKITLTRLD